ANERVAPPARLEPPDIVEVAKRSLEILGMDEESAAVEGDPGRERFADEFVGDRHGRDEDVLAPDGAPRTDHETFTERRELRMGFEVRDQIEHTGGGVMALPRRGEVRHLPVSGHLQALPRAERAARRRAKSSPA